MLYEINTEKRFSNETKRRWFESDELDLVIWINNANQIFSFQLFYKNDSKEQALTWKSTSGFSHEAVDDGESRNLRHKSSPIFVSNSRFDVKKIRNHFDSLSKNIDSQITDFVLTKLAMYRDC